MHYATNKPRIEDPLLLSKLLRSRWCVPDGLYFEVVNGRFDFYGSGSPEVYRISDGVEPWAAYPGRGGFEKHEVNVMFNDVVPYLLEPLHVYGVDVDPVVLWSYPARAVRSGVVTS